MRPLDTSFTPSPSAISVLECLDTPPSIVDNQSSTSTTPAPPRMRKSYAPVIDEIIDNPNLRAMKDIVSKYFVGHVMINSVVNQLHNMEINVSRNFYSVIENLPSKNRPNAEQRMAIIQELQDAGLFVFEKVKKSTFVKKGPLYI